MLDSMQWGKPQCMMCRESSALVPKWLLISRLKIHVHQQIKNTSRSHLWFTHSHLDKEHQHRKHIRDMCQIMASNMQDHVVVWQCDANFISRGPGPQLSRTMYTASCIGASVRFLFFLRKHNAQAHTLQTSSMHMQAKPSAMLQLC